MIKITKIKTKFVIGKNALKLSTYDYRLEIYNINIRIIIGDKPVKKYSDFCDIEAIYGMSSNWLDYNRSVVLLFNDKAINDLSTIVHECVHACDNILEDIGQAHPNTATEVNAYLTQHLFSVVLKAKKYIKSRV